jgi:hypothetical protein
MQVAMATMQVLGHTAHHKAVTALAVKTITVVE